MFIWGPKVVLPQRAVKIFWGCFLANGMCRNFLSFVAWRGADKFSSLFWGLKGRREIFQVVLRLKGPWSNILGCFVARRPADNLKCYEKFKLLFPGPKGRGEIFKVVLLPKWPWKKCWGCFAAQRAVKKFEVMCFKGIQINFWGCFESWSITRDFLKLFCGLKGQGEICSLKEAWIIF